MYPSCLACCAEWCQYHQLVQEADVLGRLETGTIQILEQGLGRYSTLQFLFLICTYLPNTNKIHAKKGWYLLACIAIYINTCYVLWYVLSLHLHELLSYNSIHTQLAMSAFEGGQAATRQLSFLS